MDKKLPLLLLPYLDLVCLSDFPPISGFSESFPKKVDLNLE